jgi:hypothetical protein
VFCNLLLLPFHVDNTSVVQIIINLVFHEHTKHIKVDCHSICEALACLEITLPYIFTKHQTDDVSTKSLSHPRH